MRSSFCCCFSIRSGASIIGWFNFIFTSFYIGMLVFALARVKDDIELKKSRYEQLERKVFQETKMQLGERKINISSNQQSSNLAEKAEIEFSDEGRCGFLRSTNPCLCSSLFKVVYNTTESCEDKNEEDIFRCICQLKYVSQHSLRILYWSLLVPGAGIVISVAWLTSVESNKYKLIRCAGFLFLISIPSQIIFQFSILIFIQVTISKIFLLPLHPIIWIIFIFYASINIYCLPILTSFVKLRSKEFHFGMEQGLLTSQTNPLTMQRLHRFVEDAFETEIIENEHLHGNHL